MLDTLRCFKRLLDEAAAASTPPRSGFPPPSVGPEDVVGRSGPANETTNDDDGAREAGSSELSELELPASWDDKALKIRILRGATLATLETELVDHWTREHSKAPFQPDDWDFMTGKWVFARSFRQRRAAMQAAVSGP